MPQSFFTHFYAVAVMWTTILLLPTWYYAYKMAPLDSKSLHYSTIASHLTGGSHILSLHKSRSTSAEQRYRVWKSVFLLLLMELHVMKRLYETLYVFNYSSSARMHIFGYLTGLLWVSQNLGCFLLLLLFFLLPSFHCSLLLSKKKLLTVVDESFWIP